MKTKITSKFKEIYHYMYLGIEGFSAPEAAMTLYRKNRRAENLLGWFFKLFGVRKGPMDYVFLGHKYLDLINSISPAKVAILGNWKQFLICLKQNKRYVSTYGLYNKLVDCYEKQGDIDELVAAAKKILYRLNPKVLVVINDSLPLERVFILASKQLGIKTVCIQHGLFQKSAREKWIIYDGCYADLMLVYDQHQMDLLNDVCNGSSKIHILGYHSKVNIVKKRKNSVDKKPKICILGQPWGVFYDNKKDIYEQRLNALIESFVSIDNEVFYKVHPSESVIPECVMDNVVKCTMHAAIELYDVFVSFTSTALLEVTLANKTAIQVYHDDFECDRFEEYGYSYTVNLGDRKKLLELIDRNIPIQDERIDAMRGPDIYQRFKMAVQSI